MPKRKLYDNPFLEARKERLEQIKQICLRACPVEYMKLVGIIEVSIGLKSDTAKDHIASLMRIGIIKNNKGIIEVVK